MARAASSNLSNSAASSGFGQAARPRHDQAQGHERHLCVRHVGVLDVKGLAAYSDFISIDRNDSSIGSQRGSFRKMGAGLGELLHRGLAQSRIINRSLDRPRRMRVLRTALVANVVFHGLFPGQTDGGT
jgi:hypothetical protein